MIATPQTERYLLDDYAHQRQLSLMILGGAQDREFPASELAAWRKWGNRHSEYHMMEGDHFFLHQHQASILPLLTRWLALSH